MRKIYLFIALAALSVTTAVAQQEVPSVPAGLKSATAKSGNISGLQVRSSGKNAIISTAKAGNILNVPKVSVSLKSNAANGKPSAAQAARAGAARSGAISLASNQKYMGAYTSDTYSDSEEGIGLPDFPGDIKIAAYLTNDMISKYDGGTIKGIRFALSNAVPVSDVFIYAVDTEGYVVDTPLSYQIMLDEATEGWNYVSFTRPAQLDLSSLNGVLIGFTYTQAQDEKSAASYPLSLVMEGDNAAGIYLRGDFGDGDGWTYPGWESSYGNLSIQAVVENDAFLVKDAVFQGMVVGKDWSKAGELLDYSVALNNFGNTAINELLLGMAVDGAEIPETATARNVTGESQVITGSITIPSTLVPGEHLLQIYAKTFDGEAPTGDTDDDGMAVKFFVYDRSLARQKNLMEEFTCQSGGYCPQGTTTLSNFVSSRAGDDIAWVAIHGNISTSKSDVFTTDFASSMLYAQAVSGYPTASFNRTIINGAIALDISLGSDYTTEDLNTYFGDVVAYTNRNPAFATVNISGAYDKAARRLDVTVSGNGVDVDKVLKGYGLTVYITEDGITAKQLGGDGNEIADYVHNHVLRTSLTDWNGSEINWTGETYENTYSTILPAGWNADNLNIVAFIAPILDINNLDYYEWVTNANSITLKDIASGINGVYTNGAEAVETVRYNAAGQVISAPQKGLNIVRLSDGKTMKVMVK